MPTAYLSASLLKELTDVSVSNPGAGEAGRLLTWNGSAFVLRTSTESRTDLGLGTLATQNANSVSITGGAISGITPLPIASGGTGSNNGSITGTGALTFAAGGTNQNISLTPSGTGRVLTSGLRAINQGTSFLFEARKDTTLNPTRTYVTQTGTQFWSLCNLDDSGNGLIGYALPGNSPGIVIWRTSDNFATLTNRFQFVNYGTYFSLEFAGVFTGNIHIRGADGNVGIGTTTPSSPLTVASTTESTSTTTGAVRIDGGLGVAGAIHGGSSLTLATDASAAQPAIVAGTNNGLKIGTATSQKLGFFNATPVVQPTTGVAEAAYVENSGGVNVNDDSTFDGYTLRQVVKALRNLGILA